MAVGINQEKTGMAGGGKGGRWRAGGGLGLVVNPSTDLFPRSTIAAAATPRPGLVLAAVWPWERRTVAVVKS
jgi:hypothetical protein